VLNHPVWDHGPGFDALVFGGSTLEGRDGSYYAERESDPAVNVSEILMRRMGI